MSGLDPAGSGPDAGDDAQSRAVRAERLRNTKDNGHVSLLVPMRASAGLFSCYRGISLNAEGLSFAQLLHQVCRLLPWIWMDLQSHLCHLRLHPRILAVGVRYE